MQPLTTEHCGSVHYITIGDSRLLTAAGLMRSPLYLIGDAASRCGLSRVGYFIPLNGRRPLNGRPPSSYYIMKKRDIETADCSSRQTLVYSRIISKTHNTDLLIFVMFHGWVFAFCYLRYAYVMYVTCMYR